MAFAEIPFYTGLSYCFEHRFKQFWGGEGICLLVLVLWQVCILRPSPCNIFQLLKPKGLLSLFWIPLDFLLVHLPIQIIIPKDMFTSFVIAYLILWFIFVKWLLLSILVRDHIYCIYIGLFILSSQRNMNIWNY